MSVLEVSATKRDAMGYLQTYTNRPRSLSEVPRFEQGKLPKEQEAPETDDDSSHVAIVKLRDPQSLDEETLQGVARTLSQLRALGLLSIVVIDCGINASSRLFTDAALGLSEAIDAFHKPGSKILEDITVLPSQEDHLDSSFLVEKLRIEDSGRLQKALRRGLIPIIPSIARQDETFASRGANADHLVLALTKYVSGMQFQATKSDEDSNTKTSLRPCKIATVERIIVLDPLGGTPAPGRAGASHRFINLEQEYSSLLRKLLGREGLETVDEASVDASALTHARNLNLAKQALAFLPPSSSALITSPLAAASTTHIATEAPKAESSTSHRAKFGFNGMVTTRKKNPLLHNLLTDKPVHSSSLPHQRVSGQADGTQNAKVATTATLVKRGMPLTIYPNPRKTPWTPPGPQDSRLRLTDQCIDLPRLVYLIENSFGRKLDVQDYLRRVNENLAGVIIAGEYEGGAILTWEQPHGPMREGDGARDRLVPYLDKFAVLRSSQGSGGVADIVFNAMVGECFPMGVCWRSRKDNPVNKWYFERSSGTRKLPGCNWSMFWTTPGLDNENPRLHDYEDICRTVEPSWADNKHILD